MSKKIINLTSTVVAEEIENVLDTYPYHPYQQAFAIPDIRQKLAVYVLSRVRNLYTVVEEAQEIPRSSSSLCNSLEQRLYIEPLVRHGIQHILQEDSDWIGHHIPIEASPAPSRWFG
jgi:hypothetical protein